MWHVYLCLFIASDACLFLAAFEPFWRKIDPRRINLVALGALLFTLVWTIQLAST